MAERRLRHMRFRYPPLYVGRHRLTIRDLLEGQAR